MADGVQWAGTFLRRLRKIRSPMDCRSVSILSLPLGVGCGLFITVIEWDSIEKLYPDKVGETVSLFCSMV